jgi:hypothetical protein
MTSVRPDEINLAAVDEFQQRMNNTDAQAGR